MVRVEKNKYAVTKHRLIARFTNKRCIAQIAYSTKRFPGYKNAEGKGEEGSYDADFHKARIFGGHVGEYMDTLEEEDKQEYEKLFSGYIKNNVDSDNMEKMYQDCHKKIRANPK